MFAIGQKRSTVAQFVKVLEEQGALAYSIVVAATASESGADASSWRPSPAARWANNFRDNGMHAFDLRDLSKQAVTLPPDVALLLDRPPGREAYPGRCVLSAFAVARARGQNSSDAHGAGSLTALPVIRNASQ